MLLQAPKFPYVVRSSDNWIFYAKISWKIGIHSQVIYYVLIFKGFSNDGDIICGKFKKTRQISTEVRLVLFAKSCEIRF